MMLRVRDIRCGYGGRDVIKGLSLQAEEGSFVGIIGPNGSGKSTLVKSVSGLVPLQSGTVEICGRPLSGYSTLELARLLAVLEQDFNADFDFTVQEVVLMGRHPFLGRMQSEGEEDLRIVAAALKDTGTAHLLDRPITAISGGERQRVLLARALAQRPSLLLLDEPTSHLDVGHQLEIMALLERLLQERSVTVLGVFHDLNLAARCCHKLLLLCEGRAVACGTPEEVLTEANILAAFGVRAAVSRSASTGRPLLEMLELSGDFDNSGRITASV